MEKLLSPVSGASKKETIFIWVASIVLTLLFVITGIVALASPAKSGLIGAIIYPNSGKQLLYYPFQMNHLMITVVVSILIALGIAVLLLQLGKGIVIKDSSFYNSLYSKITRFFPVPLLLNTFIFLMGYFTDNQKNLDSLVYIGAAIALISLCGLLFIYTKTSFSGSVYLGFLVKKCFFTAMIVFNLYYIFNSVSYLIYSNSTLSSLESNAKGCALGFGIAFGLISLVAVFFLKDLFFGVMAVVVYVGIQLFRDEQILGKAMSDNDYIVSSVFIGALCVVMIGTGIYYKKLVLN